MADQGEPHLFVDTSIPPDVMNDPDYETNTAGSDDRTGDQNVCRICRSEGSDTEPLFHPCKCSGSIKHVHQDCLMEWLSHSQKKHCELCKTPFRFTKLYSPNMPQSLPNGVFFRHFFLHSLRNLGTWLRLCLVVAVWLGILPYMIRQVWRLLFWFSDGGWPTRNASIEATRNSSTIQALEAARQLHLASLSANGTSPVTPFHADPTTSASLGGIMDMLVGFLMPISQTLNISGTDPLAAGFFKTLAYGLGMQSVVTPEGPVSNTSVSQFMMGMGPAPQTPSLLSDIKFLRNITRNPTINGLIISIAEGYVITILVVVCFILIFLIREWVVQQQPGINMGAGFNAEFVPADRGREQAERDQEDRDRLALLPVEAREAAQRPIARPRRRNQVQADDEDQRQRREAFPDELRFDRPAPVRDALTSAAEIQRQLTEEPRMTEEFLSIWRRADSNPQEVLRIIERENKEDQMRYWVNAMKILQSPLAKGEPLNLEEANKTLEAARATTTSLQLLENGLASEERRIRDRGEGSSTSRSPHSLESTTSTTGPVSWSSFQSEADSVKAQAGSDQGSANSESWVDISKPRSLHSQNVSDENMLVSNMENAAQSAMDKGKGRAIEESDTTLEDMNSILPRSKDSLELDPAAPFAPNVLRQRATSDGPQHRSTISPLAHNSWNFGNLTDRENGSHQDLDKSIDGREQGRDVNQSVVVGESAATFPGKFDFPPNPFAEDQSQGLPAWKAAQDLRVQQAIAKGREAHRSAMERHVPSIVEPSRQDQFESDGPTRVRDQDGNIHEVESMQDYFDAHPVSSDSEDDEENLIMLEQNHLPPDTELQVNRAPAVVRPPEPQGILGNIADWLWGGAERQDDGANDEHIVEDLAAEPPFVPVANRVAFVDQAAEEPEQDREVLEAAIAAGLDPNDPDAIDDAEDFEGIMELVGMRGPVLSLIQNALFSAFLLALTVAFGVWIPYNIGRLFLLLVANPGPAFKLPLRLVFSFAAGLQDFVVSVLGMFSFILMAVISLPAKLWFVARTGSPSAPSPNTIPTVRWGATSLRLSHEALDRIMNGTINAMLNFTDSDIFTFSAATHESLLTIKWFFANIFDKICRAVVFVFIGDYSVNPASISNATHVVYETTRDLTASLPDVLSKPDSWVISLETGKRATPLNLELSVWGGMDRFWATLAGYTALCLLGAMYVKKGSPFSTSQVGRDWEATIIDLLNQAGGVMKVILIISIEMLVFPLYCGLLLDAALLPLFDNATIVSRIQFTIKSPLTSIFVHWFVGTCYMFHFALFVSMCRKIMRKGVLYFIRDPDDPTFHPVRDVLERNVATQLRKILFSALVYGALVVICLGGVVWGLALAFKGVLPIHWSSNEPVLEFPIDLLFYNFLMPLAVRFFKPSDGLHAMYQWWFQKCARMLRLTWFMFDERKQDEEGYIVRRSWRDTFRRVKDESLNFADKNTDEDPFEDPKVNAYICKNGRYVRAPASDQVRISKGGKIFLEVDENNDRIDGKWDRPDGVHGRDSELYKQVYIPPYFRLRICAFIISIWLFAAFTGVCITIVPLVFGRQVFAKIIPTDVRKNDVYAFSIGIYILGSALYILLHVRQFFTYVSTSFSLSEETPSNLYRHLETALIRVGKILWTYSAFLFLLPTLSAFMFEFYAIIPLRTYFSPAEPHTIHFVQSWTLGLLYVKLTTRLIQFYPDSRPAASLRLITRDGYLNPDARVATRSFILPATVALSAALCLPWAAARFAVLTIFRHVSEEDTILIYRYVYPFLLTQAGMFYMLYLLLLGVKGWRMRIRDEVYLIGERLHNFGDNKKAASPTGGEVRVGLRRIET